MAEQLDWKQLEKFCMKPGKSGKGGLEPTDIPELKRTFTSNRISEVQVWTMTREQFHSMNVPVGTIDRFMIARDYLLAQKYEKMLEEDDENRLKNQGEQNEKRAQKVEDKEERKCPRRSDSFKNVKKFLAIGNPGSGKSTILNSIAGEIMFESGLSIGSGLTDNLYKRVIEGTEFHDTPGIADDTYRDIAGKALSEVFKDGGPMKIIFFVMEQAGRLRTEDAATMKLILDSVSDIKANFGIIVNKIPNELHDTFKDKEIKNEFMTKVWYGIDEHFQHGRFLFVKRNEKLSNAKNKFLDPKEIDQGLQDFISSLPFANVTPGKFTNIPVDRFERLMEEVEEKKNQIQKNKEIYETEKEKLMLKLDATKMNNANLGMESVSHNDSRNYQDGSIQHDLETKEKRK